MFFLVIAIILGCFGTLMSLLLLFRFRYSVGGPGLWALKSYSSSLAPFIGIAASFCAIAGIISGSFVAILLGSYCAFIFFIYLRRISRLPDPATGFEKAFGPGWEDRIPAEVKANFLKKPAVILLPADTDFNFKQNLPFCTIPGTKRQLLCDLWLPSGSVAPSGLAFIYLHGGAWYFLDKDFSTRPLFRHLASQGHVIMDIGYRVFPETDMTGMVHDAKRAIAWMKTNASMYRVNTNRIVIGGGSAGGHIALLAAYLPDESKLVPRELEGVDLSVLAVVSAYGPPDLEALYYHTDQHLTTRLRPGQPKKDVHGELPRWVQKMMGENYHRLGYDKLSADAGALGSILGCHPDECREVYSFFSPITHVRQGCPPTLIIHGEHDMFTPVDASRRLYKKLIEAGVPAVMHVLPQTDHGFDLFMPKLSAVAHTAFYVVERFLALMVYHKPDRTQPANILFDKHISNS